MIDLTDRVAVVSGAGAGMGLRICAALLEAGASVVGGDLRATEEFAALDDGDGRAVLVEADLTRAEGAQALVDTALDRHGRLDALVNNVGGMGAAPYPGFAAVTDEQWSRAFELNLFTAVKLTRAAIPHLVERRGAIVNVASVNAFLPGPGVVDYSAAKAALVTLSKTLSLEFAPQGVRVNVVSPGPVRTGLWLDEDGLGDRLASAMGTDRESAMRQMVDGLGGIDLGRFGRPDEIARVVRFLLSDEASYITGSNLVADGGLVKTV
jgi:NAD(P)-dependent dehydrogenase (short-subunit alcohol dehydrogenase family)